MKIQNVLIVLLLLLGVGQKAEAATEAEAEAAVAAANTAGENAVFAALAAVGEGECYLSRKDDVDQLYAEVYDWMSPAQITIASAMYAAGEEDCTSGLNFYSLGEYEGGEGDADLTAAEYWLVEGKQTMNPTFAATCFNAAFSFANQATTHYNTAKTDFESSKSRNMEAYDHMDDLYYFLYDIEDPGMGGMGGMGCPP